MQPLWNLSNDDWQSIASWSSHASETEQQQLVELILGRSLATDPLASYCPHVPWPRQRDFLKLSSREALFGGAAGGGKSEALLMAALQFVDVPGYAALILRRDTRRLELPGGLIPRSHEWLQNTSARWSAIRKTWLFPTENEPATIAFGYLSSPDDKYRYASSEFQFIGFDELTEFPEDDYLFLFSRLRRTRDLPVPLRMRAASNPGNRGHQWVKQRFITREAMEAASRARDEQLATSNDLFWNEGRAYLPSRIIDNPSLDRASYLESLAHLPRLIRERLLHGDWSVQEDSLIRAEWLRYFTHLHGMLHFEGGVLGERAAIHERDCQRFMTIDPAGTSEDRARESRSGTRCYSVLQIWDLARQSRGELLFLRHQVRARLGFDELCHTIRQLHQQYAPQKIWIENEKLGQAAVDVLRRELPIATIATRGRDKVTRAARLITKLERREILLPSEMLPWKQSLEAEMLTWTGQTSEPSDQIDAAAYAAEIASEKRAAVVLMG